MVNPGFSNCLLLYIAPKTFQETSNISHTCQYILQQVGLRFRLYKNGNPHQSSGSTLASPPSVSTSQRTRLNSTVESTLIPPKAHRSSPADIHPRQLLPKAIPSPRHRRAIWPYKSNRVNYLGLHIWWLKSLAAAARQLWINPRWYSLTSRRRRRLSRQILERFSNLIPRNRAIKCCLHRQRWRRVGWRWTKLLKVNMLYWESWQSYTISAWFVSLPC